MLHQRNIRRRLTLRSTRCLRFSIQFFYALEQNRASALWLSTNYWAKTLQMLIKVIKKHIRAKMQYQHFWLEHLGSWTGNSLVRAYVFFCGVRTRRTRWLGVITDPFHWVACCWNFSKTACGKPLIYCYYSHSTWRTIRLEIAIYTHISTSSAQLRAGTWHTSLRTKVWLDEWVTRTQRGRCSRHSLTFHLCFGEYIPRWSLSPLEWLPCRNCQV